MDLRASLKEQYHAGLAMLADCVAKCPEDLWSAASPSSDGERTIDRGYWRIAYHAVYFTHLYLGQNEAAFQPPPLDWAPGRRDEYAGLWAPPWDLEPYELPEGAGLYSRQEILAYIEFVGRLVDPTVDELDLDTDESGFRWYRNISKLSHQLMNLRHIQGHVGQLSELLLALGIDTDWVAKASAQ
jgi:hypothetical protein